jgi:IS30 family transposase
LLRQFFPAGTEFHRVSRREIKRVQAMLNDPPTEKSELAQSGSRLSSAVALGA